MNIRKKLLGVAAVFIVIMFLGISMQSSVASHTNHKHTINMSDQVSKGKYLIQNPSNTSDNLSNLFNSWLMNDEHADTLSEGRAINSHMLGTSQVEELFPKFIKDNPVAISMINKITNREKIRFRMENQEAGLKFINYIKEHPKMPVNTVLTLSSNNSRYFVTKASTASYPSGFPTWSGEFTMVSVNYFGISWWYPGPWYAPWAGHWGTLNYGEHDTINILYVGSDAQYWYNHMYNTINTIQTYDAVGGFFTASISALGGYYGIGAIAGEVGSAIAGIIAVAAISIYAIQSYMANQLHTMYDSTYANPIKGNPKFMWEYYDINFIYPWITVVGTFASSFSWNGYTNTGTVSIFPYIPVIGNNPAFVVVSSALSGETHNIASRLGWNTWGEYYGWQW
ncbi:MAG: hypothetical protein AMDU5_GPLC00004G0077 [Thermoplasmatales archaeon Gpl]|nr:MAG: hypothetical protein AMDU5_GPLC00004G0077 [Thermoplasmatales archaeon Gpl]